MSIIKRVSKLFKADIHGLLDLLEDPDSLLKHSVREMQDEIASSEQHLAVLEQNKASLNRTRRHLDDRLEELEKQVHFSLPRDEQLARCLLRKKLEHEKYLQSVKQSIIAAEEKSSRLQTELEERRDRLQMIEDRIALLSDEREQSNDQHSDYGEDICVCSVSREEVELALFQVKQRQANENSQTPG